mmetsp:Transcript_12256/g.14044  ORF Transcript_12256/g.14044 Transcript_12256/m.14044 type:complete len:333 (+) Transcript_12256:30-1028(+)
MMITTIQSLLFILLSSLVIVVLISSSSSSSLFVSGNVPETLIAITGKDYIVIGADTSVSGGGGIAWMSNDIIDKISILSPYDDDENNNVMVGSIGSMADSDRIIDLLKAHCAIREFENGGGVGSDVEYITIERDATKNIIKKITNTPHEGGLSVTNIAHLARTSISQSLRSQHPLNICLLIAGMKLVKENQESSNYNTIIQKPFTSVFNDEDDDTVTNNNLQQEQQSSSMLLSGNKNHYRPYLYWIDSYGSLQELKYGAQGYASNFCLSILDSNYKNDLTKEDAIALLNTCFKQLRTRYVIHSPNPPRIKCIDTSTTSTSTINDGCRCYTIQ